MRRIVFGLSFVIIIVILLGGPGRTWANATALQDEHPFIGTWIVDTMSESENDSPEIAIATSDGRAAGMGANRVAAGTWEAIDDHAVDLTLVTVFDNEDGAGYVVRGPHTVDETGAAWTCECTFTVVSADGTVLDSGVAPASGRRLPLQGADAMGMPLEEIAPWTSLMAVAATPAP